MDRDTARGLARLVAYGRTGVGILSLLVPRLFVRRWLATDLGPAGQVAVVRMFGIREIALGVGTLHALGNGSEDARVWVALGGVADVVDTLAVLGAAGEVPTAKALGSIAISAGAAVASIRSATALDRPA